MFFQFLCESECALAPHRPTINDVQKTFNAENDFDFLFKEAQTRERLCSFNVNSKTFIYADWMFKEWRRLHSTTPSIFFMRFNSNGNV